MPKAATIKTPRAIKPVFVPLANSVVPEPVRKSITCRIVRKETTIAPSIPNS